MAPPHNIFRREHNHRFAYVMAELVEKSEITIEWRNYTDLDSCIFPSELIYTTILPYFILRRGSGNLKDHRAVLDIGHLLEDDALSFLHAMSPSIKSVLEDEIREDEFREDDIVFTLILTAELEKTRCTPAQLVDDAEPEVIATTYYFRSLPIPLRRSGKSNPDGIEEKLGEAREKIMASLNDLKTDDWVLKRCKQLDLRTTRDDAREIFRREHDHRFSYVMAELVEKSEITIEWRNYTYLDSCIRPSELISF